MGALNNGGPAFPVHGGYEGDDPRNQILGGGVSVRDYFAGKALSALISREPVEDGENSGDGCVWSADDPADEDGSLRAFACRAYMFADAMLAERAK